MGCIVAFELPFDSQTRKPIDAAGATKHKPNRTKPNGSNQEDPKIKPKQQQKQKTKVNEWEQHNDKKKSNRKKQRKKIG